MADGPCWFHDELPPISSRVAIIAFSIFVRCKDKDRETQQVINRTILTTLALMSLAIAGPAYSQGGSASATTSERALTIAERQAAWSQNKTEYRRRVAQDGQASADRWLDGQARAMRGEPRPQRQTRKSKKDCKKVRWVNRATPGFGGGPMTMSRVAVCAD